MCTYTSLQPNFINYAPCILNKVTKLVCPAFSANIKAVSPFYHDAIKMKTMNTHSRVFVPYRARTSLHGQYQAARVPLLGFLETLQSLARFDPPDRTINCSIRFITETRGPNEPHLVD